LKITKKYYFNHYWCDKKCL